MPADMFDDQRRAWIAAHAGVFMFQKRRAELLAKRIRARTRSKVGGRPDPHDDQVTPPFAFRSTSTTSGSFEAALVATCAVIAPFGWAMGKVSYHALVALIPAEKLRAYPIVGLIWASAASGLPLVIWYDPGPSLTATLVMPWLLAQVPAGFAAAAVYGVLEGWLAIEGSSDLWPLTPVAGEIDDDLILDAGLVPMATVLDPPTPPSRKRLAPSNSARRRTPPTVHWLPILGGAAAAAIIAIWYAVIVADATLNPPPTAPVGEVHAAF
ncbi:MAG: hypothetical protein K2X97_19365 [Mycobacteriaceae bacterium]|nr:hypothetical protein [Mycobacteriaceae bacterium]